MLIVVTGCIVFIAVVMFGWLGSRAASVLDSGAEWPGFKSQPRRCLITVLGKLFTPIVLRPEVGAPGKQFG